MTTMNSGLAALASRKKISVLGINSGTSADGLDFSLVTTSFAGPGTLPRTIYRDGLNRPFPPRVRREILRLADHSDPPLSSILTLDAMLGDLIGREAAKVIAQFRRRGLRVDAICSHGQTVRHLPRGISLGRGKSSATYQSGSLERIAAATGCVVVGDVRQADIATGGEGAPITVAAMKLLFGSPRESRLIVNIGGMANYFWFPAGTGWDGIAAADCGPGNVVIDALMRRYYGRQYDRNGDRAGSGRISERLVSWGMQQSRLQHRSTGRERFSPDWVERFMRHGKQLRLRPEDIIASATEVTARGIIARVRLCLPTTRGKIRLSLTGGGARNSFLVERLRHGVAAEISEERITPATRSHPSGRGVQRQAVQIETIDRLGLPAEQVEGAAYAVMGAAALAGFPLPTRWHADGRVAAGSISGKIVQPSTVQA